MLPFLQQTPNQSTSAPPASSTPHQVPPELLQTLLQLQSQLGFVNNPQQSSNPFNLINPNLGANGNRPPVPINFPNFNPLQNNQLGNPIMGSAPQVQSPGGFFPMQNLNLPVNGQLGNLSQTNPGQLFGPNLMNVPRNPNPAGTNFQQGQGQFGWQNPMQNNMNQLGNNLGMLNAAQVAALAQLMGCANQVAQSMVPQNGAFMGTPQQFGGVGVPQQPNFAQQLPGASQPMQSGSLTPTNQAPSPLQNNQSPNWQGNRDKKHGMHMSNTNHHHKKNFMKNSQKEGPSGRFQNFQNHQKPNVRGNNKFSKENGGTGIESSGPENQSNGGKKRRSLSMFYTEKEIQQWREERKRNYPSKANVEKKLADRQANADVVAEEAKLRRQQLKEVLAKQVELGFEVPEIPSHYLLDSEEKFDGRESNNKRPFNKGRFQKRFDKKGKFDRFDKRRGTEGTESFRRNERFPKRQRVEGNGHSDPSSKGAVSIKKPSLLEKLLSSDIKRDRKRLLQAFRFMVMNSFLKDWPEKPLNFPKVIVNETGVDDSPSSKVHLEDLNSSDDDGDDNEDRRRDCLEEGEITD